MNMAVSKYCHNLSSFFVNLLIFYHLYSTFAFLFMNVFECYNIFTVGKNRGIFFETTYMMEGIMDEKNELDVKDEATKVEEPDLEAAKEEIKKAEEKKEEASEEHVNVNKEELKKQLTEAYGELGMKFYKEVCAPSVGGRPREIPRPSAFNEQVSKIKDIKGKLDTIIAKELEQKGLKACPECENEVVIESKFCNMCGFKFPTSKGEEKKMRPTPVPRCKKCGANLEAESVFCPDCGARQ